MSLCYLTGNEVCVGDQVIVRGPYSGSAYDENEPHTKAIGWRRKVLRIIPNTHHPICFGDNSGAATGWIRPENLEFVSRG